MIDETRIRDWLKAYHHAWTTDDPQEIARLFADDVRYFTAPYRAPLEGTDGAQLLFWSPRGDRVAFRARGGLFTVPATGGHVQRLVPAGSLDGQGGSWGSRGVILAGTIDGVMPTVPGGVSAWRIK